MLLLRLDYPFFMIPLQDAKDKAKAEAAAAKPAAKAAAKTAAGAASGEEEMSAAVSDHFRYLNFISYLWI